MGLPAKTPIACPVCGSDDFTVVYEPWVAERDPAKLYGVAASIQGTQRMVNCSQCSLMYENPRYPAEVILQGYAASEDGGHDSQHDMRVGSFYRGLKRLAPQLPAQGARVLDIGSAGGAFLEAAGRFGYDAWGMEPSGFRVSKGKERGLQIEQGVIESHSFAPATFDMVTLWDVIEHLPDPLDALRRISKLLKPGGILLLNFPDIDTWQARLTGKHFWWIVAAHLTQFSPATITEICKRAGFRTFHFQRYWQSMEFGYLERLATTYYKIPLMGLAEKWTPQRMKKVGIPFYASQTTALARLDDAGAPG